VIPGGGLGRGDREEEEEDTGERGKTTIHRGKLGNPSDLA
jgi:hypothetical protein